MVKVNSTFALSYLASLAPYDVMTLLSSQEKPENTVVGGFFCRFTMFWVYVKGCDHFFSYNLNVCPILDYFRVIKRQYFTHELEQTQKSRHHKKKIRACQPEIF